MDTNYVKLKDLVNNTFTVEQVLGYKWKLWDNDNRKMIAQDSYFTGSRKMWQVVTNKGQLDLSSSQLGTLLEAVSADGKADVTGKSYEVKSNGQEGKEIRYFFNPVTLVAEPEPDLEDIPF